MIWLSKVAKGAAMFPGGQREGWDHAKKRARDINVQTNRP
jgi:hypothetical protein